MWWGSPPGPSRVVHTELHRAEQGPALREQIKSALRAEKVKAIDLFKEWDTNSDCRLSQAELHRAVAKIPGLHGILRQESDALFREIDTDNSGYITLNELAKALR